MPDIQISERLISFLTFLPMFFISITIHEFAHAFSASRLGDNTAKNLGRLTLNPFKHSDLIGTLIMPIASFASGFALIGWAKPVPMDRNNFKSPLRDDAIVSAAGPFANLLLAFFFFVLFIIFINVEFEYQSQVINIFWYGVFFNIFLFAFNLLPIPPLDGSHILFDIFPNQFTAKIASLGIYGSIILMLFIYSPLWKYFMWLITSFLNSLLSLTGI